MQKVCPQSCSKERVKHHGIHSCFSFASYHAVICVKLRGNLHQVTKAFHRGENGFPNNKSNLITCLNLYLTGVQDHISFE